MKRMKHVLMVTTLSMVVGIVALAADSPPNTCNEIRTCENKKIPYPFVIYKNIRNCLPDPRLIKLNCDDKFGLLSGNITVLNINTSTSQIELLFYVSKYCGKGNKANIDCMLTTAFYTISSKDNKFLTVGNNSYGYLTSYSEDGNKNYSTGCLTRSFGDPRDIDNGTCSGIGCCQVDIPPRMTNISIEAYNFDKSSESCSYSFVVKNDSYTFSSTHLSKGLPQRQFPAVFDWTIGNESCTSAKNNGVNYGCKNNSQCDDKDTYFGYRCKCNPGYEGNPYNPIGCTDIDECEIGTHECKTKANCRNTDGNHTCFCPKGSFGDGTLKGGCQQNSNTIVLPIVLGAVFTVLFAGIIFYLINQKRKLNKLKEKFYKQNGGSILEQKLSQRQDSSQIARIFKENELRKATNNYDESLIVGRGGFGTVFKGELEDNRIVAIKKSKTIDESQIEQFINEVDVVSRINHRNVVKLLGCCLETEVPLLVYEFVSNGTLSDFIRTEIGKVNNVSWKTRLKIAAEVAGALSYLHSSAAIPIIHRDVKSDNILLDETNTAKVSDFGASRLVPLDQIEVATMVQGTFGYLDPEYMQTSQLTEKSDVYSFGVVLVELLTGEKPFCAGRPEDRRSYAMYFLSCLKKDSVHEVIHDGMWNEENKQEIKEVSVLAAKCLRLRGEERPSMMEVAMELAGLRLMNKQSWINEDVNVEESRYLLQESSCSICELGDSSKQGDYGYDSLKEHVLIALDDGR